MLPSASEAAHYSWHFTRSSPSRGTMLSRIWIWCLSFLLIVVIPGNSTFEDFSGGGGGSNYFFDCVCMFSSIDFHVVFVYTISREFTGNILQKNYKETNIFFRMDMALFLSADFHQGNEIFNVHSRGKQCAFMALSVLLTARNILLSSWSKVTFNNVKETNCT